MYQDNNSASSSKGLSFGSQFKTPKKDSDRFIPKNTCKRAYRSTVQLNCLQGNKNDVSGLDSPANKLRSIDPTDIELSYQSSPNDTMTFSIESSVICAEDIEVSPEMSNSLHKEVLATTLGYSTASRVYNFGCSTTPNAETDLNCSPRKKNTNQIPLVIDPLTTTLPPSQAMNYIVNNSSLQSSKNNVFKLLNSLGENRPTQRVKTHNPYRVLDAPYLRNDFYSNLISWSKTTRNVIVGLGYSVYIWSDSHGAIPLLNNIFLSSRNDIITCVSSCPYNNIVIIGTRRGKLYVFDQKKAIALYKEKKFCGEPLCEYQTKAFKCVSCIIWFSKNFKESDVVIGTENGEVSFFKLNIGGIKLKDDNRKSRRNSSKIKRSIIENISNIKNIDDESKEAPRFLSCRNIYNNKNKYLDSTEERITLLRERSMRVPGLSNNDIRFSDSISKWELLHVSSFQAHNQQVCGMYNILFVLFFFKNDNIGFNFFTNIFLLFYYFYNFWFFV